MTSCQEGQVSSSAATVAFVCETIELADCDDYLKMKLICAKQEV